MRDDIAAEIANAAARLIVDEGLDWGAAKQRAARDLGLPRAALPDNDQLEDAVREYIAIFHADTQPQELRALRELAARWMQRLAEFRPHLTGAVWRGTATRLSNIHLQLFCDDSKAAEIALVNQGLDFDVAEGAGPRGRDGKPADWLLLDVPCPALQERVTLCLTVLDFDDLRGALKPDARGRSERGDLGALQQLLDTDA
ncbi:MAG: hypothetical protein E6Q67_07675 [Roseateles sp.]|nr:MAG: hypothetical protein E6Q67_07675 [Roseateles sp.]